MKIRVSDIISKFISDKGIDAVFILSGTGSIFLDDSLISNKNIRVIPFSNEATGPMMASGYTQSRNKLGVVCVTTGPGGINAISGLSEAWVDSIPILIISGQTEEKITIDGIKHSLRSFGIQGFNIINLVKHITKFSKIVLNPEEILYDLEKAFSKATSERPGPVWLDIPFNIQMAIVEEDDLLKYEVPQQIESSVNITHLLKLLETSKKPIIVAGGGIKHSNSLDKLVTIAKNLSIPIVFSRMGQGLLPFSHRNNFGHGGIRGHRISAKVFKEADLLIGLGSRFATGFSGHKLAHNITAKLVIVDIDINEIDKLDTRTTLKYNCDVKNFLESWVSACSNTDLNFAPWLEECQIYKEHLKFNFNSLQNKNPINLYYLVHVIDKLTEANHIIISDAGSSYYATGQALTFEKGQKEIVSGNFASMGIALPHAIGAAVADSTKQIIAIIGDGSIETNIQELKTLAANHLNVKLFIINNNGYASIRNTQDTFCESRYIKSESTILDFEKIAAAFNISYYKLDNASSLNNDIKKILSMDTNPALTEVICDSNQKIINPYEEIKI